MDLNDKVGQQDEIRSKKPLFSGRMRHLLLENLTAYLFLAPALVVLFCFGIFPLLFAVYVSLYNWPIKQREYLGLGNYFSAMGGLGYLFFFAIAIGLIGIGVRLGRKIWADCRACYVPFHYLLLALFTALLTAVGGTLIALRCITFFAQPSAISAGEARIMGDLPAGFLLIIISLIGNVFFFQHQLANAPKLRNRQTPNFAMPALTVVVTLGAGVVLAFVTIRHLLANPEPLGAIQPVFQLVIGLAPIIIAFFLWQSASRLHSTWLMLGGYGIASTLVGLGVYLVSADWEAVTRGGSKEFYNSLGVTISYAFLCVPIQLGISLILAYVLFQNIKAKGIFRIIFFIPYIAPTVATAGIFESLFTLREGGVANQFVALFGGVPMKWLQEPANFLVAFAQSFGIQGVENWQSAAPSLALFVIVLYNIWVFVGYDTVIFLAGLGNIPTTIYEAAEVDGAGRWELFRYITLPLLSPTTYFLSVVSIIGTFKAFTHIWVLRNTAALGTADTASVYFFSQFTRASRFGYSTAMAMVLFVLIFVLYLLQNYVASKRVFYG